MQTWNDNPRQFNSSLNSGKNLPSRGNFPFRAGGFQSPRQISFRFNQERCTFGKKNQNSSIDAQNATNNTPLSGARIEQNEEKTGLCNLGYSPLSTIMIENCLEDYPDFKTKQELIGGLTFGFKLEVCLSYNSDFML
jgi:hypothetical protein